MQGCVNITHLAWVASSDDLCLCEGRGKGHPLNLQFHYDIGTFAFVVRRSQIFCGRGAAMRGALPVSVKSHALCGEQVSAPDAGGHRIGGQLEVGMAMG